MWEIKDDGSMKKADGNRGNRGNRGNGGNMGGGNTRRDDVPWEETTLEQMKEKLKRGAENTKLNYKTVIEYDDTFEGNIKISTSDRDSGEGEQIMVLARSIAKLIKGRSVGNVVNEDELVSDILIIVVKNMLDQLMSNVFDDDDDDEDDDDSDYGDSGAIFADMLRRSLNLKK